MNFACRMQIQIYYNFKKCCSLAISKAAYVYTTSRKYKCVRVDKHFRVTELFEFKTCIDIISHTRVYWLFVNIDIYNKRAARAFPSVHYLFASFI